jgi:hypothetical protein
MDEDESAWNSIRVNCEFDSNAIERNCRQRSKHPALTMEIESGIHEHRREGDSCLHRVNPSMKPFRTTM